METISAPAAGWYPDPAGSSSVRWWDGSGWTTHLHPPANAPAPAASPAAVAAGPVPAAEQVHVAAVAQPAPYAGDPRFGGPAGPVAPVIGAPVQTGHAPAGSAPPSTGPGRTLTGRPAGQYLVAALLAVALLVAGVFVGKSLLGGSDAPGADGSSGVTGLLAPGNPQVAAMRADVLNIANAEETYFTGSQAYLAARSAKGSVVLAGHTVRLSAGTQSLSVVLSPSGVGYCVRASRTPAGGGAPQVVVYISTQGGRQPPQTTTCPAAF